MVGGAQDHLAQEREIVVAAGKRLTVEVALTSKAQAEAAAKLAKMALPSVLRVLEEIWARQMAALRAKLKLAPKN
jgi:heptaprenylglyceryl phosphate synthase